ncbi:MAG TPA: DUF4352 domain-containing protein [Candidatus Paceibacterota bacterium]|nr:DUF4352 domain-containing protein [Candidatus Paceibacterota bacterium]
MENQEQKPKKKFYKRWWFWVLAVVVILIIIGTSSSSTPQKVGESGSQTEQTFKVGDIVAIDKTLWKVVSARDLGSVLSSDNQFIESKKTSGKFIKVTFEVTNNGTSLESVGSVGLVDNQNRKFSTASDVSYWIPSEEQILLLDNINPGITKKYTVIFDVPKDAAGLKFRPGGVVVLKDVYIDLGL